jgi:hypothetical protein
MEDDLKKITKKMEDDLKKKGKKGRRPKQNGRQTNQPNST